MTDRQIITIDRAAIETAKRMLTEGHHDYLLVLFDAWLGTDQALNAYGQVLDKLDTDTSFMDDIVL